ncbi:hypothetical protein KIPB_001287 [Kipferlia bialata]|uniref:Uncharacterized protein n=1 Tax=Kipferlia bialata TaxID=797122 RepID=A0A9K3CQE0_9EUKA|nr:hypothetical protein KIPB_001287 [Kipferlia bialata]|eukprot:g1287.t1
MCETEDGEPVLPYLLFVDEVDKLEPAAARSAFILLQSLVAQRRILMFVAGNLGSTTDEVARQSSLVLDHIRLQPILHPAAMVELAKSAGVFRGAHNRCRLVKPGTREVYLSPGAWNLFMMSAFSASGIPVYKPTPFFRALALASVPLLPQDRLLVDYEGGVKAEPISRLEERGLVYLVDFSVDTPTYGSVGSSAASLRFDNSRCVSESPGLAQRDKERERERENAGDMESTSLGDGCGEEVMDSLLLNIDMGGAMDMERDTGFGCASHPVSLLVPAFLCSNLPVGVALLERLPAWAGGLQTAISPFDSELGFRCEQEVIGLCAARVLLAAKLQHQPSAPMPSYVPFWRLFPQGVTAEGDVGAVSLSHPFSQLLFRIPTDVTSAEQLIAKFTYPVHYHLMKSTIDPELVATPPRIAQQSWDELQQEECFYLNGCGAQAPDMLFGALEVPERVRDTYGSRFDPMHGDIATLEANSERVVIGVDIKTARKASHLAKQWVLHCALSKLHGWGAPSYLVSIRARLGTATSVLLPSYTEYHSELKAYLDLFSAEECDRYASLALTHHVLVGSSWFGPAWSNYLTAEKARAPVEDLFDIRECDFT